MGIVVLAQWQIRAGTVMQSTANLWSKAPSLEKHLFEVLQRTLAQPQAGWNGTRFRTLAILNPENVDPD